MLVVYKKTLPSQQLFIVLVILLLAFRSGAQDEGYEVHDSESQAVTKNEWILEGRNEALQIVVLERDYGEPSHEPLRIVVGYQQEEHDFHRLTPEGEVFMEKTFCGVEPPFIADRDRFFEEIGADATEIQEGETFYEPGEYLVVYVRKYDEDIGECQGAPTSVEAYWLEELL